MIRLARFFTTLRGEEGFVLKDSAGLLLSMGVARGALFVAFLLLMRRMSADRFGLFFLGYTTLAFVPALVDFGIGQTFIRHIPYYRASRPEFSRYLHWLFFVLKLLSVAVLVLAAWPLLPLAARFLNLEHQTTLLAVAILGSGATLLYDYVNSIFQITFAFRRFELYLLLRNACFLAIVAILVAMRSSLLTPVALVLMVVLVNLGLVASAYPYAARQWRGGVGRFSEFRSSLGRYSKWLTIAAVCFAFYRRMDLYFLSHFRSLQEVGTYSIAIVMVEPVAMISPALFTVFLPKLAADPTPAHVRKYLRLTAQVCLMVGVGVILYGAATRLAFPWLRADYRAAFPAMAVLLAGTVMLIGWNMLSAVLLAGDRPDLFGKITLAIAVVGAAGNWLAVPRFGMLGAATVYGLAQGSGIVLAVMAITSVDAHDVSVRETVTALQVPSEDAVTLMDSVNRPA